MKSKLEETLEAARPRNRAADPVLDRILTGMIAASEARAPVRPRRTLRTKIVVGAIAGTMVLGTASAAAATQPWLWNNGLAHPDSASTITLPSGSICEIRAVIQPAFPGAPDTDPTIAAARAYARSVDFRSFDLSRIRQSMLKNQRITTSDSLDDQYFFAVSDELSDRIFAYVSSHGYDEGNISVESENHCTSPR